MALVGTERIGAVCVVDTLIGGASEGGSEGHRYTHSEALLSGPHAAANLADAAHVLCELHGPFPGVLDIVAGRAEGALRPWLRTAAETFTSERTWLTRLVAAAGPLPSTPGQAESEAALNAQRHALDMLAQSDRFGCALGAALALLLDWRGIHAVLAAAAERFGLDATTAPLPDMAALDAALAAADADSPAMRRAILFGGRQLLLQHHALWSLLEARESARAAP